MRPNSKEQLVGNCKNRRTLSSQNRHSSSNRLIGIFDEPRPVLDLSLLWVLQHPLKRRGGCASKKKNPFRSGADGVVPQKSCCSMRFETWCVSDHPVCAFKGGFAATAVPTL